MASKTNILISTWTLINEVENTQILVYDNKIVSLYSNSNIANEDHCHASTSHYYAPLSAAPKVAAVHWHWLPA